MGVPYPFKSLAETLKDSTRIIHRAAARNCIDLLQKLGSFEIFCTAKIGREPSDFLKFVGQHRTIYIYILLFVNVPQFVVYFFQGGVGMNQFFCVKNFFGSNKKPFRFSKDDGWHCSTD